MPDETASAWRRLAGLRDQLFELGDTRALREHPALEDGRDFGKLLFARLRASEADRGYLARYHSIVLVSPSSSSTLGSQPSSSCALATFGIRSSTST